MTDPSVGFMIHARDGLGVENRLTETGVATDREVDDIEQNLREAASGGSGWVSTRSCWIWHFIGSKHLDGPGNADTRRSLVMSPNALHEGVPTPANRLSRAVLKRCVRAPAEAEYRREPPLFSSR